MSAGDLVSGRYPLTYPNNKGLGLASNATQPNIAQRSNLEFGFMGSLTDAAASLVTGKATIVPVPVEVGDIISKVSILAGATAEATGSHAWAAVYSGAPASGIVSLQGAQSADVTGAAAIGASARYDFTLATSVLVSAANAPYGYLYVAVSVTATTVPSLVSGAIAAACQYAWNTNSPPFFGATYGSALGASAPATVTLANASAIATPPVVFLS